MTVSDVPAKPLDYNRKSLVCPKSPNAVNFKPKSLNTQSKKKCSGKTFFQISSKYFFSFKYENMITEIIFDVFTTEQFNEKIMFCKI